MRIAEGCLLIWMLPWYVFAQIQDEAEAYAKAKLPSGGIVILQSENGAMQLGMAGRASIDGAEPPEINSVFEIGSISKVMTGVLLAESVRLNKVLLEDTVDVYLPSGVIGPDNPLRRTSLLHLATHTSGLPRLPSNFGTVDGYMAEDPYAHYDSNALYAYLKSLDDQSLRPGKIEYSNLGFGLLGHLLCRAWKLSYRELLDKLICTPLGMEHTDAPSRRDDLNQEMKALLMPPHIGKRKSVPWTFDVLIGAGGVLSTAGDLISFAEAIWSDQTPEGLRKSFALTMALRAKHGGKEVGLGWFMQDSPRGRMYLHDGATGGFQSVIRVLPEKKIARVELVNQSLNYTQSLNQETRIDGEEPEMIEAFWLSNLGVWKGVLKISDSASLRLELHFTENDEGRLRCHLFSLDQHADPIAVSFFAQDKREITFKVDVVGGVFRGKLDEGTSLMDGTWMQGGARIPLQLHRSR